MTTQFYYNFTVRPAIGMHCNVFSFSMNVMLMQLLTAFIAAKMKILFVGPRETLCPLFKASGVSKA